MIKTRNLYHRGKVRGILSLYFPPPFKVSGLTTRNFPEKNSGTITGKKKDPAKS
jgi:hypothetical protein